MPPKPNSSWTCSSLTSCRSTSIVTSTIGQQVGYSRSRGRSKRWRRVFPPSAWSANTPSGSTPPPAQSRASEQRGHGEIAKHLRQLQGRFACFGPRNERAASEHVRVGAAWLARHAQAVLAPYLGPDGRHERAPRERRNLHGRRDDQGLSVGGARKRRDVLVPAQGHIAAAHEQLRPLTPQAQQAVGEVQLDPPIVMMAEQAAGQL